MELNGDKSMPTFKLTWEQITVTLPKKSPTIFDKLTKKENVSTNKNIVISGK